MSDLTAAPISSIDSALLADLGGSTDGIELFTALYEGATVGNQGYQVAYSASAGRAGIVFVGSGASGSTDWTDCASPEDGFARFLAGEMAA